MDSCFTINFVMAGGMSDTESDIKVYWNDCAWFLEWEQEKLLLCAEDQEKQEVIEYENDENDYLRVSLEGLFI